MDPIKFENARVVTLPEAETETRWNGVTKQWPLVSVIMEGVGRNAFMARHRANHVSIAYASDAVSAKNALATKASMCAELGMHVHLCGVTLDAMESV